MLPITDDNCVQLTNHAVAIGAKRFLQRCLDYLVNAQRDGNAMIEFQDLPNSVFHDLFFAGDPHETPSPTFEAVFDSSVSYSAAPAPPIKQERSEFY